jgi:hypothetical protein
MLSKYQHFHWNHILIKSVVFGDVTPCASYKKRRFRGTFYLHHQGEKFNEIGIATEEHSDEIKWRRYVPSKRRLLQEPHGITSQKTPFFIVTAVETSNLT